MTNIKDLLKYMYSLERFGIKPGLEVISKLLKALDNPHKNLKYIHIAGTNGKGSTAAMIESVIRKNGFSTGLYTSPHLVRFNERIKINNKDITDEDIATLVEKIKKCSEENNLQPTFFEFTTALAFLYFYEKKPDYIVLETGMGGRLDATNVVTPKISVITNIAIDHVKHLGKTEKEIAVEKAGIIKKDIPLVTAEENEEVLNIFRNKCKETNSKLYKIDDYEIIQSNKEHQVFKVRNKTYEIKLVGEHQIKNACLAIKALELLGIKSIDLKDAFWPGRIEIVRKNPLVIIDSAHNTAGMKALINFLGKNYGEFLVVFGMIDGDYKKDMIKEVSKVAKRFILTQGKYRGENPDNYSDIIKKDFEIIRDVKEAVKKAIKSKEDVLITGSIYMIGEAEELFLPN
ncbi:MAG: bifunctional folylpolyglutamate synthase/dihydrofolate synthase [Nanoarchaeota archaeon]|nr:bifunctional folylpolyglutamate synthase/dihydrofolate synthase [Nanoarchaeota archaeon]MBU1854285.1 bifunctional folylpolyglutamate synthase/dihydrofolate synthase [Nanoarchaeota archaeon]